MLLLVIMTHLLLAPQPFESGDLKDVVMMDDSIFFGFEDVSLTQLAVISMWCKGIHIWLILVAEYNVCTMYLII